MWPAGRSEYATFGHSSRWRFSTAFGCAQLSETPLLPILSGTASLAPPASSSCSRSCAHPAPVLYPDSPASTGSTWSPTPPTPSASWPAAYNALRSHRCEVLPQDYRSADSCSATHAPLSRRPSRHDGSLLGLRLSATAASNRELLVTTAAGRRPCDPAVTASETSIGADSTSSRSNSGLSLAHKSHTASSCRTSPSSRFRRTERRRCARDGPAPVL